MLFYIRRGAPEQGFGHEYRNLPPSNIYFLNKKWTRKGKIMKCKNETCDNEAQGRGSYCSDSCKTLYNRNRKRNKSVTVTAVTPPTVTEPNPPVVISEEDQEQIDKNSIALLETVDLITHAPRTNPDTLNTGEYMTADELKIAGFKANRVSIPGDWYYEGVCERVDGVWKVA